MSEIEVTYLGRHWRLHDAGGSSRPMERRSGTVSPYFRGSLTALGTALMRAAHGRLEPRPLIDDPWGDRLVPEEVRAAYRETALSKLGARGCDRNRGPDEVLDAFLAASRGYPNVIMRARHTEDALRQAVHQGIRQYVIIGAGFDSFALRAPAFANGVSVVEIDQPSTQALKRQRIAECGVAPPRALHFVAADLTEGGLERALAHGAYQSSRPAFFSWLGVTMFLTRAANLSTLQAIARLAAPGSELMFTYFNDAIFRSAPDSFRQWNESNRAAGEPFLSGFVPDLLREDLRQAGWELLQDLSEPQLFEGFAPKMSNPMTPLEYSRIAHARII